MYILALDSSNKYSSVAISIGPDIIYAKKDLRPNAQAENLIIMIEESLRKTNLQYKDLNYLSASSGPGSFTGIRIGLAAARGIALSCPGVQTICVNNFETINFRIRQQIKDFDFAVSFVNAYRDELYLQLFTKQGACEEPRLMRVEEAQEYLQSLSGKIVIAGSGIERLHNTSQLAPSHIAVLPRFAYPDARFICRVAHQHIARSTILPQLDPLYIREPDAKLPSR